MNNDQFRKLLLANATKAPQNGASSTPKGNGSVTPLALGSRMKSSIPMTPRSVAGGGRNNEFARQLAERDQKNNESTSKRFRTSAPKGSRFAEGYIDRTKERQAADEAEDDKAARIKALDASLKKGEIDQATFDKLSSEIAGGEFSSTHLIKGLDFKLLERIRKGEDVFGNKTTLNAINPEQEDEQEGSEVEVDDAFEELEDKTVDNVVKEKAKKKGKLATGSLAPGRKRSRDQILAELKAAREAAKLNQLGSRFKRIGTKMEPGSRTERDAKGREVLIIVDEDGNERRKVRKIAAEIEREREAFKVAPEAEVLGMQVPEYYQKKLEQRQKEEEEDIQMFSDVESDYNPLKGLGSDSEDEDPDEKAKKQVRSRSPDGGSPRSVGEIGSESPPLVAKGAMAPPHRPQKSTQQHPRNYFKSSLISEQNVNGPALTDPSVLAALQKARTLNAQAKSEEDQKEADRESRLKKMLASANRDDADLDLGFGSNRMQDEEEMEEEDGKRTRLSTWGGNEADNNDGRGGVKDKRKRGGKKRKGDGDNIADVMQVLEKRKDISA